MRNVRRPSSQDLADCTPDPCSTVAFVGLTLTLKLFLLSRREMRIFSRQQHLRFVKFYFTKKFKSVFFQIPSHNSFVKKK